MDIIYSYLIFVLYQYNVISQKLTLKLNLLLEFILNTQSDFAIFLRDNN